MVKIEEVQQVYRQVFGCHKVRTRSQECETVSEEDQGCLVHGRRWRSKFQQLLNILREKALIPPCFLVSCNGYVCCCHASHNDQEDNLVDNEFIPRDTGDIGSLLCHRRLISLLKAAVQGDFSQPLHMSFDLALEPKYVGHLVGKRGSFVKQLLKKHKGIKISIHPTRLELFSYIWGENKVKNVFVEIICKQGQKTLVDDLKLKILNRAGLVQEERRIHEAHKKWAAQGRFSHGHQDLILSKQQLRSNFESKKYHSGRTVRAHTPAKILASGSRCVQCLEPYCMEKTHSDACCFHPQFLVNDKGIMKWQCCGTELGTKMEDLSLTDLQNISHRTTGCERSCHVWHLHNNQTKLKEQQSAQRQGHGNKLDLVMLKKSLKSCKSAQAAADMAEDF